LHRLTSLRRSLLFTGVHAHSYSKIEEAVILPYVTVGRRQSEQGGDRPRRAHPDQFVVGRTVGRRHASAAPRRACLITQQMLDRLGD
jgi:glucose-1-phosphate adenylyltransferase